MLPTNDNNSIHSANRITAYNYEYNYYGVIISFVTLVFHVSVYVYDPLYVVGFRNWISSTISLSVSILRKPTSRKEHGANIDNNNDM